MAITVQGVKQTTHAMEDSRFYADAIEHGNQMKEQFDELFKQGDSSTPLLDVIGGGRPATNNISQWDTEPVPTIKRNRAVESMDLQFNSDYLTSPDYNVVQTSVRDWTLSTQATKVMYAGRSGAGEMERKMDLALVALRRDMECVLLRNMVRSVADWSAPVAPEDQAAELGGIPYFIDAYATANGTNNVRVSGVAADFDYDDLAIVLKAIASYSGVYTKRLVLMGDVEMIDKIQGFTGNAGTSIVRTDLDSSATLNKAIDVIRTRFGVVELVPNSLMPANVVYVLQPDTLKLSFASGTPIEHTEAENPSRGQARKLAHQGFFHAYYTLQVVDPLANGIIYASVAKPTGDDLWAGVGEMISFA